MTRWRLAAPVDDIREALLALPALPERFAIATLVEVDGSAPRDVGAQMLITPDEHWGFLSGGCIEDDVARHGRAVMAEGAPRTLRYGEGSPWIDIKLACGSGITVLVEPVAAGEPAVAALLDGWRTRAPVLFSSDGTTRRAEAAGEAPCDAWDGARYTRLFPPPLKLVLIGEDGATLSAASLALAMGWQVALVTPGGPEAAPMEAISYHRGDPEGALKAIAPDRWTAVAVLSHDREDDERGLAAALSSPAFYVGAIGARVRLEQRVAKLRGHGVGEAALARLHAPIGLYGFGKAPREVALSLVAEVAQAFHAAAAAARSSGVSMSSSTPLSAVSR
ncbi:XdhC family protein [Erythrobacter donghaensis]|jgi:xanthine dehydrogenase accessory factor|uniref:XdhC family protein n=1 Tax=Erythrobacter donghaensis TaxID=267135 RepID=UPI000938AFFB|nr:XdhC family protein [Erythrobacter donghaensis]